MIEREPRTASVIATDLTVVGDIKSSGSVVVDGTVEGDIRASLVTVSEGAQVLGEIVSEDLVVSGRVAGRLRGLKVRLTSSARVEGDVVHKTIAIESGAHFDGSVQRVDDPLSGVTFSETAAFEVSVNLNSTEKDQLERLTDATKGLMNFLGYELEPGPSDGVPDSDVPEQEFQLRRQNVA
jgi:cytoskeletal protein CcmA (bactofilin family)